jgi:hypothetical protein
MSHKFLLIAIIFVITGCAATYNPIVHQNLAYPGDTGRDGVKMLYEYDVLQSTGNQRYAKKENKRAIHIVAVEIANQTNRVLKFSEDVELYSGNRLIRVLPPDVVFKEIHQVSGLYMLWSLFWVVISKCENNDCSVIPVPIGVGIGLINFGTARKANKDWMYDLTQYNMLNKTIQPGETVNGLIGFSGQPSGQSLQVRVKAKD